MNSLGWGDPIESKIVLVYRRQGEKREHDFHGAVAVLGEDHKKLTWLKREDLPLRDGRLDLTKVPVVAIGGKRKHQPGRVQEFLNGNPSFQGAFLLHPGTGNWDLGEGMLFVTSREILAGKRVSGGRPEVQFTNHRWLRDGRYVADRAKMLHGKVLEVLEAELEQEPGAELIVKAVAGYAIQHRLREVVESVARELGELEGRRVMLSGDQARDMTALVHERLVEKLRGAAVRFVRDIPEGFGLIAEEVAPELVSERETLGTVEVPGLGRRLPKKQYASFGFGKTLAAVHLTVEEFRRLESWPFVAVYPVLAELAGTDQLDYELEGVVRTPEEERLGKIRSCFSRRWLDHQRSSNRPKDEKTVDPKEVDLPATPEPKVWGFDLMTREPFTAYAALRHCRNYWKDGSVYQQWWAFVWFDDQAEAAKVDAEARREAESYITARRLEAELATEAKAAELPAAVPSRFVEPSHTPQQILAMAGFTGDQYRIREDLGYGYSPGYSGGRNLDGEWCEGASSSGSFVWKADDGVWEIGKSGLSHLLEGGSVGDWNRRAFAKPVLSEMGAAEKIPAIQAQIKAELQEAQDEYRAQVREFVEALESQPAYACLPSAVREKVTKLVTESSWSVPNPSAIEDELRAEWPKAEALLSLEKKGEMLANFGGSFRVMGATNQAQYWVVRPDGSEREPDQIEHRKRYTSEGFKLWRLVSREELAISWFKAYTAADHEFKVDKLPTGGCTVEQCATIKRIEREISERFHGATGFSGHTTGPSIGKGWGLRPPEPTKEQPSGPVNNGPVTSDMLDALRNKWGGSKK